MISKSTFQLADFVFQAFDDVVRKFKPKDNPFEYKKRLVLDQEKSKDSLAAVYENEFLKQTNKVRCHKAGRCVFLIITVFHLRCRLFLSPPLGDKVSMLTHIYMYPHKARRKIEVTICKITRLTAHFMCGLMSDLLICTCL